MEELEEQIDEIQMKRSIRYCNSIEIQSQEPLLHGFPSFSFLSSCAQLIQIKTLECDSEAPILNGFVGHCRCSNLQQNPGSVPFGFSCLSSYHNSDSSASFNFGFSILAYSNSYNSSIPTSIELNLVRTCSLSHIRKSIYGK